MMIYLFLLGLILPVQSYIPALPSNQSSNTPAQNDKNWIIQLNWHPIGIFSDGINHQLRSESSNHSIYQGVLLHFSEFNATNQPPAIVPWIAMINCDSNSTVFSIQDDIFTLARDRGAAAAMLYSLTSHSCEVNPEYIQNFEKPLDVFSAANLQGARLIESQFSNVLGAGYWFQSGLLNSSAPTILEQIKSLGLSNLTDSPPPQPALPTNSSVQTGSNNQSNQSSLSESSAELPLERRSNPLDEHSAEPSHKLIARSSHPHNHSPPLKLNMNISRHSTGLGMNAPPVYLIATLANAEITGSLDQQKQDRNQNTNSPNTPGNNNNPNTGLAMIILYAITGCVSFIFRFLVCILVFACLPLPLLLSPHTDVGRFLIVIISGAIRAIRNPDRYGPRPGGRVDPQTGEEDPYAQPRQTRAAGLGKAILDTFPIVKFGRQRDDPKFDSEGNNNVSGDPKAIVNPASPGEERIMMSERSTVQPSSGSALKDEEGVIDEETWQIPASQVPLMSRSRLSIDNISPVDQQKGKDSLNSDPPLANNEMPTAHEDLTQIDMHKANEPTGDLLKATNDHAEVGSELVDVNNSITCPICVCDFEDDDDIRMLPCDARHQFHKECVDPWLLNESKFCPLCRWDLSTRKDGSKIVTQVVESESDETCAPQPTPVSGQPEDDPSVLQTSQFASSSRSSPGDINNPSRSSRTFPPWLSFGSGASPSDGERSHPAGSARQRLQNRTSNLFSIVPHARKRRHGSRQGDHATPEQTGHPSGEPSSSSSPAIQDRHPNQDHIHAPIDLADESASKGRFHKYLANIRRKKLLPSSSAS
ncbi:hypothetical protein PGT21_030716 [Puccinia graminis f. sp. tritici]|uniref:RING-type domain-containing protein n=1 Tax=Puccinia graminis f. sp. tritici TaxID=56615 RepID=A0A5B0M8B0_PUCGR|nr:hypothetical protein PGT21_030716 [Puccinia graminis f. sp. tritici]